MSKQECEHDWDGECDEARGKPVWYCTRCDAVDYGVDNSTETVATRRAMFAGFGWSTS